MKIRAQVIPLILAIGCMMLLISTSALALDASQDFEVEPHRVRITESFHGRTVHISAEIPEGAQAVVELKGHPHTENLLLKGRRWGLWMSVGEITVEDAPSLYLAMTTKAEMLSEQGAEGRWGYGAIREEIRFSGSIPESGPTGLFREFIKLKEKEGLYGEFPAGLKAVANDGKMEIVQGQMRLPGNVRPGNYEVSLTVLKDGQILEHKSIKFQVVMRQLTAFLASLAQDRPTLYGFLAVGIAMFMGLLMGFVFKGKGTH